MIESFGKYRVIERIGEGGFGQVFRGRDPQLAREVAIKTVSAAVAQARERFPREAAIAAGLRHPAIVTIYDFGEQDGVPYLVQEYLPGEDLAGLIARRAAGDLSTRVRWLRQVASGLHYAHGKGIVHRDIKPGNVRVLEDGTVRIMDFGIAKVLDATVQLTGTNVSLGTSGYVAPEQLEGKPIDGRADMFAFGVMAYELVTYERAFEADTVSATLYRILTADPAPIAQLAPDTPQRLVACIERCLRKRREDRYADMAAVDAELAAVLEDLESGAGDDTVAAPSAAEPEPTVAATIALPPTSPGRPAPRTPPATPAPRTPPPTPVPEPANGTGGQKAFIVIAAVLLLALTGWAAVAAVGAFRGRDAPDAAVDDVAGPDDGSVAAADSDAQNGVDIQGTGGDSALVLQAPAGEDGSESGSGAVDREVANPPSGRTGSAGTTAGGGRATEGGGAPGNAQSSDSSGAVSSSEPSRTVPVDASKVLVLISGERADAVGAAQNAVLGALLSDGRPIVDPDAVESIRADAAAVQALQAGASPAVGVGREYGAGVVVVASLSTDAAPAPGGFVTGTAVLSARFYDSLTGRLLLAETYRIGSGGTPGRAGATETAAVTQAAESVARQLARAILTKTGG